MVANTLLEIYTLMFGWNMYGAIWDVLVGSGIALVPFIAAIIANFRDNYSTGQAAETIKSMELTLLGMIVVLMLCVIPYKGFSTQLSTVRYELGVPDCNPPANVSGTGNNTATGFDTSFSDVGGWQVYKPVAWSFIEFLSSAITHTTIKSMSCVNNYEYMLMRVSHVTIQDDTLRDEVRRFKEVCYNKAVQRFKDNPPAGGLPANVTPWADIDWIGSRTLLGYADEYYSHPEAYVTNMDDKGFSRQPTLRKSDEANQFGANPYCKEVWLGEQGAGLFSGAKGLREKLLDDIPSDESGDILDTWKDWGSDMLTMGTVTNEVKEDLILKMILDNNSANLSASTNINMSNNFDADQGIGRDVLDKALGIANIVTTANEFLQANSIRAMFKIAGPMILALMQMIVIIAAPFIMLLGRYQIASFVGLGMTYFSLEFVNAIWAAMFWFDNRILDLYASQAGFLDVATNGMLISMVSTASILLMPTVWLSIMAYSGAGMLRGMGTGGVGGGAAAGGTGFKGGVGSVGRGAKSIAGAASSAAGKVRGR